MRVAIIGAGITGLSCAYFLRKKFTQSQLEISLFEASERVGGNILSSSIEGAVFESGPRSIRAGSKILQFLQELGLKDELIFAARSAKKRFLAESSHLIELPSSLLSLITTKYGRKIVKACLSEFFCKKGSLSDESVHSFFSRRFGEDFAETFINPWMAGIYAASPHSVSMRKAFSELSCLEEIHGSVIRGVLFGKKGERKKLFSLKGGLETLPKAISSKLQGDIQLQAKVEKIKEKGSQVELVLKDKVFQVDFVISTLPISHLRKLLEEDLLMHLLPEVFESSVASVSLGYKNEKLSKEGFGFLTGASCEQKLLGIIFDSAVFPEQNGPFQTRLSVMMGGERDQNACGENNLELQKRAEFFCQKYLGLQSRPDFCQVVRAKNAITCYPVGFEEMHQKVKNFLKTRKIELLGTGFYGISVPDCILHAMTYAENFKI